jgi:hypothetical protein
VLTEEDVHPLLAGVPRVGVDAVEVLA